MSNKIYTTVPAPKVPRNTFNRSHNHTFSCMFHFCVPTLGEEILPGDRYLVNSELFARLQPMVAPVFNQMKISQHAFFVPLRTLHSHFAEFMFNNEAGNYTDVLPYFTYGDLYSFCTNANNNAENRYRVIRLADYLGLSVKCRSATTLTTFLSNFATDNAWMNGSTIRFNLSPFLAYTKIWNEYFRDENLVQDPFKTFASQVGVDVSSFTGSLSGKSGTVKNAIFTNFMRIRNRAWAHDRFTSALPWAQRGPDVLLPVSASGTVDFDAPSGVTFATGVYIDGTQDQLLAQVGDTKEPIDATFDAQNFSTTINEFRRAERLQRWYENSARGGTRPNEATLAHWGIRTPDATLDRAEFLGGSMQPIVVSDIAQTSETSATSPQGTLAGKGTSYNPGRLCKAFFTEHGFLMVFTSVLCRANYSQGTLKMFSRMQREEYAWPEFANLGEEPVFTKEIDTTHSAEDDVFGYVPRYSDYKSAVNRVSGDFKTSLAFWTQIREFANQPQLNYDFMYSLPSLAPFAVSNPYTDLILITANYNIKASRLLPFYGVPTI